MDIVLSNIFYFIKYFPFETSSFPQIIIQMSENMKLTEIHEVSQILTFYLLNKTRNSCSSLPRPRPQPDLEGLISDNLVIYFCTEEEVQVFIGK